MSTEAHESEVKKEATDQGRGPEDVDCSQDGTNDSSSGKRKFADRDPESPGQEPPMKEEAPEPEPYAKKERTYYGEMDTDSPSSYPKHVLVPTSEKHEEKLSSHSPSSYTPDKQYEDKHPNTNLGYLPEQEPPAYSAEKMHTGVPVLTPDSAARLAPSDEHQPYDTHPEHANQQQYYPDVYRAPSYTQEMEYGRPQGSRSHNGAHSYGSGGSLAGGNPQQCVPVGNDDAFMKPRRWACDYCNVATFLSYEEACAHEEVCAQKHRNSRYNDPRHPPRPPVGTSYSHSSISHHSGHSSVGGPPPPQPGSGLGALYHASQEVVTPPTPHHGGRHHSNRWSSRGPPLPVLPHEQGFGYGRPGQYDIREDPAQYHSNYHDPHYQTQSAPYQQQQHHYGNHYTPHHQQQPYQHIQYHQKRMLLAMPSDTDSLSDRQCFVRAEMVEIFAATEKDVSARHSKGAQKLIVGQVGIRCVHCSHLRPRDRAERAVCYPSSVSRIYQTVADMQRFHFEQCREIPDHIRQVYKKLKTTRPRGVGSPQSYWVSSAGTLGLVDTESGIRFDSDLSKQQQPQDQQQMQPAEVSISTH